jgi:hypothetical protein
MCMLIINVVLCNTERCCPIGQNMYCLAYDWTAKDEWNVTRCGCQKRCHLILTKLVTTNIPSSEHFIKIIWLVVWIFFFVFKMHSLYIDTDVDVFSGFQHDFHTRRYSCRLTVTPEVTLVHVEVGRKNEYVLNSLLHIHI